MTESPRPQSVLRFRPNVLEAPGDLDVATVEFLMCWPDDEARQSRAMDAAVTHHLIETRGFLVPRSEIELSELARAIFDAPRLMSDLADDAKDAAWRGGIAGRILFEAVRLGQDANLSRIKFETASIVSKRLKIRMSEKTIDNRVWPTYRSVSPFWAALLYRGKLKGRFPCNPSDLGAFLATADAFRRLGEATHTPQSPNAAVLRRGESIQIPSGLALPAVDLEF